VRTPHSDVWDLLVGGSLAKAGTSEGADRGWETRRGRMAAGDEEPERRMVRAAEDLAAEAHAGQTRGHGLEDVPYLEHPRAIAARVAALEGSTPAMVAAAWLHDTIEDTPTTAAEIAERVSPEVAEIVGWLTDKYTKEAHPDLNRKARKERERQRLAGAPVEARTLKLLDRLSNLVDMRGATAGFQRLYADESEALLGALAGTHAELEDEMRGAIAQVRAWAEEERPAKGLVLGLSGFVAKAGTAEGAKRGWKTRKKMMAAVKPEEGEGRKKKAEDEPAGKPRGKKAEEQPAGKRPGIGLDWLKPRAEAKPEPGAKPAAAAEAEKPKRPGIGLDWLRPKEPAAAEKPARKPRKKAARKPRARKPKAAPVVEGPPLDRPPGPAQKSVKTQAEMMQRAVRDPKAIKSTVRNGVQGVGKTYRMTFADGTMAAYKPTDGTGLHRDSGLRHSLDRSVPEAARESATHAISQAAGFNVVPHIELGDFGDGDGHAMAWVDGSMAAHLPRGTLSEDASRGHPDLHRIAALDLVIGNTDRHGGNFMKGEDGRYYAIDNGLAFPRDSENEQFRSAPLGQVARTKVPAEVAAEMGRLTPDVVARAMSEAGFSKIDIEGAQTRLGVVHLAMTQGRWPGGSEMRRMLAEARRKKAPARPGGRR